MYLGFLPRRSSERHRLFQSIRNESRTLVAFESPHRLVASLEDAKANLGDRPVVVARELTKIHEEFVRGTLSEVARHFLATPPRGEITVVFAGGAPAERMIDVAARVAEVASEERHLGDAASALARETGVSRREAYRLLLGARNCAKM